MEIPRSQLEVITPGEQKDAAELATAVSHMANHPRQPADLGRSVTTAANSRKRSILMPIGLRQWLESITTLFDSPDVRAINKRPSLTDADFHREYYANTEVTQDTCARVRRILCEQLRLFNTRPADNVATLFPDIDLGEVCFEIGEEFGVSFLNSIIENLDGSVDSLIRETQRLTDELQLTFLTNFGESSQNI